MSEEGKTLHYIHLKTQNNIVLYVSRILNNAVSKLLNIK